MFSFDDHFRLVLCLSALLLTLGCGGGGGGGGETASAGAGSVAQPAVTGRTLTLNHTVTNRALPSSVVSLRLTGFDASNGRVYGPSLFVFQPSLTVVVPQSLVVMEIEYLNAAGVFGTFRWTPNFGPDGRASLEDPAWSDVNPPDPPLDSFPSAAVPPTRTIPERVWGADRYLVFATERRVTDDDLDDRRDIYLRDLLLGTVERITVGANGDSSFPSVSEDGRFIVFASSASNLTEGDNNSRSDIVLYDRTLGSFRNLTRAANGTVGEPTISGDGSTVAFASTATNLVEGDTTSDSDVVVYDRTAQTFALASAEVNSPAYAPSLDRTGRRVAFNAKLFGNWQVLVWNRLTGSREVVSESASGTAGNGDSFYPTLSETGVVFSSQANNLIAGDSDDQRDLFRWNGTPSRLLRGDQPVTSRDGARVVGVSNGDVVLIEGEGEPRNFGSGAAGAVSNRYLALERTEGLFATNPAKGAVQPMASSYVPSAPVTGPAYQDLNINLDQNSDEVLLDFNSDGVLDLVATATNIGAERSLVLAQSTADGTFSPRDFDIGRRVIGVAHGRINADAHQDLVVTTVELSNFVPPDPRLRFYAGDGAGNFALGPEFSTTDGHWPLVGHLNAGAELDVLLMQIPARLDASGPRPSPVLLGNGDGSFTNAFTLTLPQNGSAPVLGDFNADGIDDVAVIDSDAAQLQIHLNNGDGTFPSPVAFDLGSGHTDSSFLTVTEWNGAAPADLVVTGAGKTEILVNQGGGSFSTEVSIAQTGLPFVGELDDISGKDLLLASGRASFYSQGGGEPLNSVGGRVPLRLHDYTGDGLPDLLTHVGRGVTVLPGLGGGLFSTPVQDRLGRPSVQGDFDGDLIPELVDRERRLFYQGGGQFTATTLATQAGAEYPAAEAGDLNGDGRLDKFHYGNGGYQVLLGDGQGDFTALTAVSGPGVWNRARLSDLNLDGLVDVVIRNSEGAVFLEGQGDGTFAEPVTLVDNLPVWFGGLAPIRDFDVDGILDLIISWEDAGNTNLGFFAGEAFDQYADPVISSGGVGSILQTLDTNSDGLLDVLALPRSVAFVSSAGGGNFPPTRLERTAMELMLNQGGGSFSKAPLTGEVPLYDVMFEAVSYDADQDGLTDILAIDQYGNSLVFEGRGTSLHANARTHLLRSPVRLHRCDFGFDGRFEIVYNASSGTIVLP